MKLPWQRGRTGVATALALLLFTTTTGATTTGAPATGATSIGAPATRTAAADGTTATGSPATDGTAGGSHTTDGTAGGSPATGTAMTDSITTGTAETGTSAIGTDAATGSSGRRGHRPALTMGYADAATLKAWASAQLSADRARHGAHRRPPVTARAHPVLAADVTSTAPTALVLYDTTGPFGYLGELYAMSASNLAGHFGTVTAEPVSSYTAGQVNQFTATIYIGSTYYGGSVPDAVPAAFYTDVVTTTHPVVWMDDNIWNLADAVGPATFATDYGWDPTSSYFASGGSVGNVTEVDYAGQALTRTFPAGTDGGVLHPDVLSGPGYPAVTALAQAVDTSTSPATRFPWAVHSGNLTYIGEIPFAYVNETNRIIAFEDLLYSVLAPSTATRHRAMVRLEDISPASDPTQLMNVARYLAGQHIPYGFNVIPVYTDPNGYYNNGTPKTITLAQAPSVVNAIKYMLANGGTMVDEGYTHQYSNVANPYTGVSGDDFEFFLAHVDGTTNSVIMDGPVPQDSATWATGRVASAKLAFTAAGLIPPTIWVTPHYAASATDYAVFKQNYAERYDRTLYFAGLLSGKPIDSGRYIGEFFPYPVTDLYGTTVLPENLGDYEPVGLNNNPVRLPADLIHEAQLNLAVRDGFASFFYDPSNGVSPLQQTVTGILGLGYTFTSPASATQ
jgi:uncharacterized protein YdaL